MKIRHEFLKAPEMGRHVRTDTIRKIKASNIYQLIELQLEIMKLETIREISNDTDIYQTFKFKT